jgi:tRNA(fMet)-specific endonuclease VapC
MAILIDTNIAILLRDREPLTTARIGTLAGDAMISVVTQVELEGGVYSKPPLTAARRASLDVLMQTLIVMPFGDEAVLAYRRIVAERGFVRQRLLDRMIAATALVYGVTLITCNGDDFRDVPGLRLEVWPSPEAV